MRLAYRTRPGIPGPSKKAAIGAVCLAAAAGFYGFTTSIQKASALRNPGGAIALSPDLSRAAVGVGPTPSLVYAVTDQPLTQLAEASPTPAATRTAAVAEDPVAAQEVALISQPVADPTIEALAVSTAPLSLPSAPAANEQALPASAIVEAEPSAQTPVTPTPTP